MRSQALRDDPPAAGISNDSPESGGQPGFVPAVISSLAVQLISPVNRGPARLRVNAALPLTPQRNASAAAAY